MASKTYIEFTDSYRPWPANAQRQADVPPDEIIEVSIYLKPRPDTGSDDEARPHEDWRTALPARRAAQHRDDIRLLSEFAAENGLTVSAVEPARRLVKLSGPASKMEVAFGTRLGIYHDGQHQFRGRAGALRLPQDVHTVVQAVLGLDTRRRPSPTLCGPLKLSSRQPSLSTGRTR